MILIALILGLEALVKELFAVQEQRNALLHSAWNYSQNFGAFMRMKSSAKATRGLKHLLHRMPPEKIKATRGDIAAVADSLARFTMAYIQEPKTTRVRDDPANQSLHRIADKPGSR